MMVNNKITISEMFEAEDWIENIFDKLYSGCETIDELSAKLKLSVDYVSPHELQENTEAMLAPTDDEKYLGSIKISNIYKNTNFSYMHEIMHYLIDVGKGKKVTEVYARPTKGSGRNHHEQYIDYCTAAATMSRRKIKKDIQRYDSSNPKLDEITFINELCAKYKQDQKAVVRRIQEVRKYQREKSKKEGTSSLFMQG